jgi:hypothetical protein
MTNGDKIQSVGVSTVRRLASMMTARYGISVDGPDDLSSFVVTRLFPWTRS